MRASEHPRVHPGLAVITIGADDELTVLRAYESGSDHVLLQHGAETMLRVYDTAAELRPGRAVVDTTVNLAVRGLLTPPVQLDAPAALPAHQDQPPAASDTSVDDVVDEDLDDDENPDEDPEAVHDLHDRLIEIRRAPRRPRRHHHRTRRDRGRKEAVRILTDLLEEIHQLPNALAAAIASQDTD